MQTQLLRFCKDIARVSSYPFLEITTKSIHFLPAKKKIPTLWIERQTNKNEKGRKTLHLNTECSKKFANCKDFFKKCE